jgi:transglutaminase-like putative cysteine protease
MILSVEHVTTYEYASRVELAAHLLHLRPRELPWQRVLDFALLAHPAPDRERWRTDHFGNPTAWLFLDRAHGALEVTTRAVVDVTARPPVKHAETAAWEHIAAAARRPEAARQVAEFIFGSAMAPIEPAARDYAAASFPPGRPILAALLDLMARISQDFRFDTSVTTVSTPVQRVLELRAGVCQDFAHVMIAGLRGLGLPARYVSGYVRTVPPPGQARLRGADQSHAWVQCWLGPVHGWIDLDPTNDIVVTDGHVWLGWGRDYADVSPIRGVLLGGGRHSLRVSVDIEPGATEVRRVG